MCDKAAEKVIENSATAGMLCPIPFLEVDACDLENYKHPPFMFILWYMVLLGEKIYEKVKELLDKDGGEGGDDKGKDDKKKDDKKEEDKKKDDKKEEDKKEDDKEEEKKEEPPEEENKKEDTGPEAGETPEGGEEEEEG